MLKLSTGLLILGLTATPALAQTSAPATPQKPVSESIKSAGEKAKNTVKDAAETVKDKAGDAAHAIKEKTGDAVEAVKEKTGQAATAVKNKATETKEKASESIHGKPANGALIDINSASVSELSSLHGVGPVRAAAIVKGRPYHGKDDLVSRDIIPANVYADIKDHVIAKQK